MKIATYNVNGVNGRLPVLLRWLDEEQPDIVCLQELKAPQDRFPLEAIQALGYSAVWLGQSSWNGVAILARGAEPHEIRLVVNPAEAEVVRRIFARYLELGSVHLLRDELASAGICTKVHVTSDGRQIGGGRFGRGALYHLLKNRTYVGEIPHKGQSYPGQHSAIIDRPLFDAVQQHLAESAVRHDRSAPSVEAPLKGLVFGAGGRPMTPTSSRGQHGRSYRYYTALALQQGLELQGEDAIARVPAPALERAVLDTLRRVGRLGDHAGWADVRALLARIEVFPRRLTLHLRAGALLDLAADHVGELERLQRRLSLGEQLAFAGEGDCQLVLTLPIRLKLFGGRTWIVRPDGRALAKPALDRTLIKGLQRGHAALRSLGVHPHGSAHTVGRSNSPPNAYQHALCAAALLAPDIQRAILDGRQPPGINLEALIHGEVPISWAEQRRVLGFHHDESC